MRTPESADDALTALPHRDLDEPPEVRRATVTLPEAAKFLGISRSTAYELARRGELPVLRLGRRLVIPIHALDALLQSVAGGQAETSTST